MSDSILKRLLAGEHIVIVGGTNDGGLSRQPSTAPWYGKVRQYGKYLHSTKVAEGVEMWADDDPSPLNKIRRSYTYRSA